MASIYDLRPDVRDLAQALIRGMGAVGLQPRLTSTVRTGGQQARLRRRWLAGQSPYPAAPPGHSTHELIDPEGGLAFDLVAEPMDSLADAGEVWEAWGGVWGGHIGDPVHFESGDAQAVLRRFESEHETGLDLRAMLRPLALGLTSDNPILQGASAFLGGPIGAWTSIYSLARELF